MVRVDCLRCGAERSAYGVSDASVRACFAMLRDACPNNEENFYVDEDE